ncbi:MAG TPA: pilus assembly protein TadG-related protein, partial [Candidatus Dormibacteraeota bacterium]|nr:pilus assembly protein TadG-related protein [Candidatus Dormibacteraeota bacterium]
MRARDRRCAQRGQVVPIAAICSALLLGGAALAVDLSLQTDRHLDLQNATDAAALVAARDLGATHSGQPNQGDRKQGAIDALRVVYDHLGWGSTGTTWATSAVGTTCDSGSDCHVTATGPGSGSGVSATVDIPPKTANNTSYDESPAGSGTPWGYAEVSLHELQVRGFGGALGFGQQTAGAHSVGYHYPAGQGFGFALYSGTLVQAGNSDEIIDGNVYAYRDVQPQSSGKASICADTDSSGNKGHVVLGAPQSGPFPSPDPAGGAAYQYQIKPTSAQVITHHDECADSLGKGEVAQTASIGSCGTLTVQGVDLSTSQDPNSLACMADPPVTAPDLQGPSLSGNVVRYDGSTLGNNQSVLTVSSALTPGLYYITHNPNCSAPTCTDVVIDGHGAPSNCTSPYSPTYTTCLLGVTFWLDKGATIGVSNGASVLISPYMPPSDPSLDPNDGRFSIYAPAGSSAGIYETNTQSVLTMTGTVYMPSGTMSVTSNGTLGIDGQAIVNAWNVQSGNHTNPVILYDPGATATQREVLQLVE